MMKIEDIMVNDIVVKKITPEEGFLLTDGETITDALFMGAEPEEGTWWEIPVEENN